MRTDRIIAAIALFLLTWIAPASALQTEQPGYPAYEVRLEVARNGVHLGAPVVTAPEGEASTADLFLPRHRDALRVSHRVTRFPGAEDSKALLELEFFGLGSDGRARRLVAPTLGVELGMVEYYEVRTAQGVITVRAMVEGLARLDDRFDKGPRGFAYPSG